ncbi:MAG: SH3 domain-containing protein, partial [Proteobacteria bacterium]|nr:SH3 domain-containing protein [Pseudomonadota bacterium]
MKTLILTLTAAIGLASTSMAPASPAYLVQDTELMSGPDQGYPLVDNLPSGDEVDVQGCTDGYYWCDVIDNGERGWVPGNALEFDDGQDEQPVALPDMGYSYGIPIVVFSIQPYWNAYYSDYPFFVQRWSWYYWAPPYRSGPPMPPPHVVPLPHPIPDPPPPRVVHLPTPIFNPPPRVVPLPHPIPDPPPPRVVHL